MEANRSSDRELVEAIGACLRIILDDIRSQYRHVRYETRRLEKSGVEVSQIMRDLGFEVNVDNANQSHQKPGR